MKKILFSFMALTCAAMTFTACEDVPAPYDVFDEGDNGGGGNGGTTVVTPEGSGTVADPFNVAAAIEKCKEVGNTVSTEKYYIKGKVAETTPSDDTYGNATFDIVDSEGGDKFKCFQVAGTDGKKLPNGFVFNKGDEVVVYGAIYNYNGKTPETVGKGAAYVVSVNGLSTDSGSSDTPTGEAKGDGTAADPFNVAAAIAKCKAIGQTVPNEKYYVTGIAQSEATADGNYGNVTFDIADAENGAKFKCFQVAGSNGEKLPAGFSIKKGDVVVVYGPIYNYNGNTPETAGKSAAYIVTVNGKATNDGGSTPPSNEMGTANNPITVAAALTIINGLRDGSTTETEAYVKGKIKSITEVSTSYGNATYIISDEGVDNELTVFRGKYLNGEQFTSEDEIKVNDVVVIKGKLQKFVKNEVVTPEIATGSSIITLNGQSGEQGNNEQGGNEQGGGETASSLTNGDFETWSESIPTGWKSASTASSATLSQSTDAHGGSYSCNVNGKESSNVRLASQEITLAAGSYTFSFWVKPTTEDLAQVRPGYVVVVDNQVSGSYQYGDYATLNSGWQQISYDFTLSAETTVCLVVMNPKKSNYSSGKDVLVDDAVLTKK